MPRIHETPQLLFVYGTLKKGKGAHSMLHNNGQAKFIGGCSIPGVLVHLGGFPGLIRHDVCRATGEVWEVSWETILACDGYEGVHNGFYTRDQVVTPHGRAWVYYKNGLHLNDTTLVAEDGEWHGAGVGRVKFIDLLTKFQKLHHTGPTANLPVPVVTQANSPEVKRDPPKEVAYVLPRMAVGPGVELL